MVKGSKNSVKNERLSAERLEISLYSSFTSTFPLKLWKRHLVNSTKSVILKKIRSKIKYEELDLLEALNAVSCDPLSLDLKKPLIF